MKRLILILGLFITVTFILGGCRVPSSTFCVQLPYEDSMDYDRVTLEEAEQIVGSPLPRPSYLPDGLEIQEIYLASQPKGWIWVIHLLISDEPIERQPDGFATKMMISIWWRSTAPKMPWAKPIPVGDRSAFLVEEPDYNVVTWRIKGPLMDLYASKQFSVKELSRVIESIESQFTTN